MYQLALTFPIGSVKCERSISSLRRVHNYTRSTMGQSRLCNLAILTIESEILGSISNDKLIDQFALTGPHKILL